MSFKKINEFTVSPTGRPAPTFQYQLLEKLNVILRSCDNNMTTTAKLLGVTRFKLMKWMEWTNAPWKRSCDLIDYHYRISYEMLQLGIKRPALKTKYSIQPRNRTYKLKAKTVKEFQDRNLLPDNKQS